MTREIGPPKDKIQLFIKSSSLPGFVDKRQVVYTAVYDNKDYKMSQ